MEEFENTPLADYSTEKRGNGTEVFSEPYSEKAVDRLKNMILTFYRQGDRKFYSIHVDGEIVVDRNSDGRKFNRYLEFVNKDTRTVEVRMYKGKSFNCNKYIFILNKGLSGVQKPVNMQEEIDKALKEQEVKNELIFLRSELEKKNRKLKKLKKAQIKKSESFSMGEIKKFLIEGKGIYDVFTGGSTAPLGDVPEAEASNITVEPMNEDINEYEQALTDENEEALIYKELVQSVGLKKLKSALKMMALLSQYPELENVLIKELKKRQ